MRLPYLTIFAMTFATLGAAFFFVGTMDAPLRQEGPHLGKYTAAWRTALLAEKQPVAPPSPLTNVTIINAAPR